MRDITVKCMAMLHVERYKTWQFRDGRMLQTVFVSSNSIN